MCLRPSASGSSEDRSACHPGASISFARTLTIYRRTKIVVTMGPASSQPDAIRQLLDAGMDVARINTAHTGVEKLGDLVGRLRQAEEESGRTLAILLDLAGPKIRIEGLPAEGPKLVPGQELSLGSGEGVDIRVRPKLAFESAERDARVMLDDGRIELQVVARKSSTSLRVRVVHGGEVQTNKGVNFPGVALAVPSVTEEDAAFLHRGLALGVDWVALSF
ncbi:MAG: pyruvate kinase, partial [Candidatus Neomarinimicrobiota bacterium]